MATQIFQLCLANSALNACQLTSAGRSDDVSVVDGWLKMHRRRSTDEYTHMSSSPSGRYHVEEWAYRRLSGPTIDGRTSLKTGHSLKLAHPGGGGQTGHARSPSSDTHWPIPQHSSWKQHVKRNYSKREIF